VGDLVVLGANARDRLGVVNGTTAIITKLDVCGRTMTVRTLEEEPPKIVRLPGWYLDAAVRPGQSRRVDLAYARTDMRSRAAPRSGRCWPWTAPRTCRAGTCSSPEAPSAPTCT